MPRNILITGGAGFIGSSLVDQLLLSFPDYNVICIDNFDPFYSIATKEKNILRHVNFPNYSLFRSDISDYASIKEVFIKTAPEIVVHLAAKAGVRPSLADPVGYTKANITGTINLLELSKEFGVQKFIFGSSSSVYGSRKCGPFSEEMKIDRPISPYAATKASGEQICYTYSHLYDMKIVCLRFFTVYGPKQRPDLAIHKFSKLIMENKPIPVYGDGRTVRDYTYIDDILQGIIASIDYNQSDFEIFNLGESRTVELNYLINLLEVNLKKRAIVEKHSLQPGDVPITYADISKAKSLLNYDPKTPIELGIKHFVRWFNKNREFAGV